jgi:hypothetical protein
MKEIYGLKEKGITFFSCLNDFSHPYTYPTISTQFFNKLLGTQMFFGDIEIDIV